MATGRIGPIPADTVLWLALAGLATLVLTWTAFGRHLYALGTNRTVAQFSGIATSRVTVITYVISGTSAALAGIVLTGYVGQAYLGMGDAYLFSSVAAVAIGGASILGGSGHYLGTVAGALILTVLAGAPADPQPRPGGAADHLRDRHPRDGRRRDDPEPGGCRPMRITRIETITVGAGWKNWLFARVHTDEGLTGIGEGTLNGFVRTIEAAIHELEHLAVGEDPTRPTAIAKRLLESVSNDGGHLHKHAVAAIETACWDILGKSVGLPVHALVGGRVRDSVLGYANGWYRTERTPEAFGAAAEQVVAKGFKALKVDPFGTAQGFIGEQELGVAVDIVSELRRRFPEVAVLIDVHARFAEAEAIRVARAFEPLGHLLVGGAVDARARRAGIGCRARDDACGSRPARRSTCRASSSRSPKAGGVSICQPEPMSLGGFGAALGRRDTSPARPARGSRRTRAAGRWRRRSACSSPPASRTS